MKETETREITFSQLLAEHASSFSRMFGFRFRSDWNERSSAVGIAPSTLETLYPLDYFDIDARLTAAARLDPTFISRLYGALADSGAQVDLLMAFTSTSFEEVGTAVLLNSSAPEERTLLEAWSRNALLAKKNFSLQRDVIAVERFLARLIWAFKNPKRFDLAQQRYLLVAINDLLLAVRQLCFFDTGDYKHLRDVLPKTKISADELVVEILS